MLGFTIAKPPQTIKQPHEIHIHNRALHWENMNSYEIFWPWIALRLRIYLSLFTHTPISQANCCFRNYFQLFTENKVESFMNGIYF